MSCVQAKLNEGNSGTCYLFSDKLCETISNGCPSCDGCERAIENLLTCNLATTAYACPLSCGFNPDPGSPTECSSQLAAHQGCFEEQGTSRATCMDCMQAKIEDTSVSYCGQYSDFLCTAIETGCLGCQGCEKVTEELLGCNFGSASSGCPFYCGFVGSNVMPTSPANSGPTPAPPPGTFTQTFEAWWMRIPWQTDTTCIFEDQTMEIACDDGSSIAFVGADTEDSVSCIQTNDTIIVCTDDGFAENFVGRNNRVIFECQGDKLVGSTLTLGGSQATCNVVPDGGVYGSHASLSTLCGNQYASNEDFLECTNAVRGSQVQTTGRYHCLTNIPIPGTSGQQQLDFPAVTIETASAFVPFAQTNGCFTFEASAATTSPPSTPAPVGPPPPTQAPPPEPTMAEAATETSTPTPVSPPSTLAPVGPPPAEPVTPSTETASPPTQTETTVAPPTDSSEVAGETETTAPPSPIPTSGTNTFTFYESLAMSIIFLYTLWSF